MTDSFQAAPGTFVVLFNPQDPENPDHFPVVGWTRGLSGYDPITIVPEDGVMEFGKAIQLDHGDLVVVVDPTAKKTFWSLEAWLEYMKGAKPVAKPNKETGIRRRVNLHIQFGEKTYVNKSFWHFKTPSDSFLFELEGGESAPDDARVSKINRDTYYKARKNLEVVPYADLFNVTESAMVEDIDEEAEDLI
jgi:hypothetical protein